MSAGGPGISMKRPNKLPPLFTARTRITSSRRRSLSKCIARSCGTSRGQWKERGERRGEILGGEKISKILFGCGYAVLCTLWLRGGNKGPLNRRFRRGAPLWAPGPAYFFNKHFRYPTILWNRGILKV